MIRTESRSSFCIIISYVFTHQKCVARNNKQNSSYSKYKSAMEEQDSYKLVKMIANDESRALEEWHGRKHSCARIFPCASIQFNSIQFNSLFPQTGIKFTQQRKMMGGGGPYKSLDGQGQYNLALSKTSGRLACPRWPS